MDPFSSFFHQCATEVDSGGAPVQTDFGMEPTGHMKARKKELQRFFVIRELT